MGSPSRNPTCVIYSLLCTSICGISNFADESVVALLLLQCWRISFISGRVQLNLFLCCPFGQYELDLVVESFSDEGSDLQQRTAWEIENGPDEV